MLPLLGAISMRSTTIIQVQLQHADARELIYSLSRPWPARWLSALCGQQDQRRQMAQNENGEETKKSEHDSACVIVSSTTLLSLSEADGGRCGQQVAGQKVLVSPDRTPYHVRNAIGSS